jgi:uncharacterized membrane protein YphA (DoxX/SURF4 family)
MNELEWASLLIRLSVGATMISFGINQIIKPNIWQEYIPKWLEKLDPLPTSLTLQLHGVANLALGFLFVIGFLPEFFDWVVLAWWLSILPFAFYARWTLGARDVITIVALIVLILLNNR